MSSPPRRIWIVSACLLGAECRYDGAAAKAEARAKLGLLEGDELIPVCPEVEGGLPVPRPTAQLVGGDGGDVLDGKARVRNEHGEDVTEAFVRGADTALALARRHGATHACLKARSPSCGHGRVYSPEGLFEGNGVAAARLERAGLKVLSDEELSETAAASEADAASEANAREPEAR